MTKILLAAPGTGKTWKVKNELLNNISNFNGVLVLSFTGATIKDLLKKFSDDNIPITEKNCMTLHSYALKLNHKKNFHVLDHEEEEILKKYSKSIDVELKTLCEMLHCITYDQMIIDIIDFAKSNEVYLKEKIGVPDLLIVDEYQDFNDEEQHLVQLIAGFFNDTIILGDDDQSIYRFKGATADGIIGLFENQSIVKIPHENTCRRCPDCIVEKATNLIINNKNRVIKDWKPFGIDGNIEFCQKSTQKETVSWLMEQIQILKNDNPADSIMILSPAWNIFPGLQSALEEKKIDFVDFFSPIIDLETKKIIWKLRLFYTRYKFFNFLMILETSELSSINRKKIKEALKKQVQKGVNFEYFYKELEGLLDDETRKYFRDTPSLNDILLNKPWLNIASYIKEDQEPEKALEWITPVESIEFDKTGVNIMTIFKSKGLEADHVFILGLVDGILPRKTDSLNEIEEQRRVLFVGMTRALKSLFLVSTIKWPAEIKYKFGANKFSFDVSTRDEEIKLYNAQTSPFVNELKL